MEDQLLRQQQYTLSGFSDTALNTQSILDVFVLQNIIDSEDAQRLKSSFRTNREVEGFLLKNHLVSKDTINKAYSIILKVPYIGLMNVEIPDQALAIIPKNLALKYGIIPFDLRGKLVRLAVCNPADLLLHYTNGLAKLFESKNLAIELFITGQTDFNEVTKQFNKKKGNQLLMKHGSLPVIQLRNYKISDRFLKKIPKQFIEKYRIVVFEENVVGDFLIACETPDSAITKKVLEYIEKENGVNLELFATSHDDIDYVLASYDGVPAQRPVDQKKVEPEVIKDQKKVAESEKQKAFFSFSLDKIFGENKTPASPSGGGITINSISDFNENKPHVEQASEETMSVEDREKIGIAKQIVETPSETSAETSPETRPETSPEIDLETSPGASPENKIKVEQEKAEASEVKINQPIKIDIADDAVGENKEPVKMEAVPNVTTSEQKVSLGKDVMEAKDLGLLLDKEVKDEHDLEGIIKEGYVPKIVAGILNYALNKKVSDIHIEPQSKVLRIRIRIDGVLIDTIKMPLKLHPPIISRIKIISKLKIDETRIPQDGRFDVVLGNREIDVRVSSLPTVHGEKIVLRILDKSQKILSLEDLGMQGTGFDKTIEAISKPWGIILSTGPTGSGKSTTLTAIINRLNTPGVNISTLEDPVEYETPGVNQTQVKPEIGFTFAAGLRSLLRQDPNIIMVGEIRDGETAGMATHAALTGHLVLSTLHTNDTAGTLPRLINMGIEPFLITSSMNLVLAQRLIRKVCPKCKEEMKLPPKIIEEIKVEIDKIPATNVKDRSRIPHDFKFYYGRGCDECTQGYRGRIGLFEVMSMSNEIEELAINKRPANEIKEASIKNGMITMKQDGIIKALQGITTVDEVMQATMDKES